MIDAEINELETKLQELEEMDPLDTAIPDIIRQIERTHDHLKVKIDLEVKSAIQEAVQILLKINTYRSREAIHQMIEELPEHEVLIRTMANI